MTLATIVYLIRDKQRYENKMIRFTEVGSEVLLLITSIFIQEFMRNNAASQESTLALTILVLTSIGILTMINITSMVWSIVTGCKKKFRMKALEKIRKQNIMIAREKKAQQAQQKK